jgi:hypothetical protein
MVSSGKKSATMLSRLGNGQRVSLSAISCSEAFSTLDLLITAAVEVAKRRGRLPPTGQADESVPTRSSRTDPRRRGEGAAVSLTRGQINAVRAAFKAGIKPSPIARQFGISQSNVRKVLASDTGTRLIK